MSDYHEIKAEYDAYYKHLLMTGIPLYRDTKLGTWGKAIIEEVHEIFKNIKLDKYSNFLDLGSGDGCVTLIASLFTEAYGVECDKELIDASVNIRDSLNLNANFVHADFNKFDINEFDVIFIHPDKPFHRGLEKIFENYNGMLIVYGEHFLPTNLKLIKDLRKEKLNAFIYKNLRQ